MIEKKLKNGTVEADVLITATMTSSYKVWTERPIVLYELHQKCLNKDHNSIKNIVLSAMIGEGLNLALTNPIAH